jgi:hypothetical protein
VVSGTVEALAGTTLAVRSPRMRAVANDLRAPLAEVDFVYRGPTTTTEPLESGTVRQQIGLKLRAQDDCNVVYVMWTIEPESAVLVAVKYNPGQRLQRDCGPRGYHSITPHKAGAVPAVKLDERHALRALIEGTSLTVWTDKRRVWEGELERDVFSFDGPVGIRSDNARFDFELAATATRPGP